MDPLGGNNPARPLAPAVPTVPTDPVATVPVVPVLGSEDPGVKEPPEVTIPEAGAVAVVGTGAGVAAGVGT